MPEYSVHKMLYNVIAILFFVKENTSCFIDIYQLYIYMYIYIYLFIYLFIYLCVIRRPTNEH